MIIKDNFNISEIYLGTGETISAIYKGDILIWENIRSCYGKGFWDNEKPWSNEDGWQN